MDEELLKQLTTPQLAAALSKAQAELEGLIAISPDKRSPAQKTRFAQLVGDDKTPGWIKSLKTQHAERAKADAEEAKAKDLSDGLKAWLATPTTPIQHSGAGGDPGGLTTPARIETVRPTIKSFGQLVVESDDFKRNFEAIKGGQAVSFTLKSDQINRLVPGGIKTLMATTAGYQPDRQRLATDRDVDYQTRPPRVRDLIRVSPNAPYRISWMEQTTRTNNAAAKAEGSAAGENAYAWTERTADAVTIPVTIPVTEQQLKTIPQIESIVQRLLMEDLVKVEEDYILSGDATATPPQLPGILNHASLQTIGVGTDAKEVKIAKAITKLQTIAGRYRDPTACLIHPNDMQAMRLSKDDNGQYLLSHPLINTSFNWTIPLIPTVAITEGIALVGDFERGVELHRVDEVGVEFGYNSDDYGKLRRTARCWIMESMAIYMGNAFCSIDFAAS